jgi:ribose/xylose/arabinose/galactoside ABC-type transport system permease subunit
MAASQGFIVIFAAWAMYLSIATDQFLTSQNLLLVVRQASIFAIVGIGTTMVVLLGELDISFGSIVSLAGCVGAAWIVGGHHPVVGFALAIAIGTAIGLVNGVLVTYARINSVVVTLGTLGIAAGLAAVYTSGSSIFGDRLQRIFSLAQGKILGVPTLAVIAAGLYLAFSILVNRTRFGAHLYATGDSEVAAFRTGVRVRSVKLAVFVIAGALAGFAAMLQVARVGRAQSSLGADFLFPVLTAVILGGVSMHGGKGRLLNTAIASVFLASITNGLILLGVDTEVQQVVQGVVLIAAVSLDRLRD